MSEPETTPQIVEVLEIKSLPPKVIRLKDAPRYLGMNKNWFRKAVKPILPELPVGERGVGFDRLDLDQWVEDTKQRNKCPVPVRRKKVWDQKARKCRAWSKGARSGTSTKYSMGSAFAKALARRSSRKQKGTSSDD